MSVRRVSLERGDGERAGERERERETEREKVEQMTVESCEWYDVMIMTRVTRVICTPFLFFPERVREMKR